MAETVDPMASAQCQEGAACLQEVLVRDIRIAADIGVHAHERGRPQALNVHVRLRSDPLSEDELGQTIDYNLVLSYATDLAGQRISLIETFARRLAETCLRTSSVREAEVQVEKIGALPNGLAATRIVLTRH